MGRIMKKFAAMAAGAAALIVAVSATAQTAEPVSAVTASPVSAATAAPANASVLRVGTEVPLKLSEALTTKGKKLKTGYRFHLEVSENVMVGGRVVIPAGTPAFGEVTEVRNKGMWGKSGHINARVLYALPNGRQIRLTGNFDDKGVTGTAGVVGAAVLIPVAGFFMTGTSANLAVNTPVKAFVDEDVPLSFGSAAPVPMEVPATPPATTGTSQ